MSVRFVSRSCSVMSTLDRQAEFSKLTTHYIWVEELDVVLSHTAHVPLIYRGEGKGFEPCVSSPHDSNHARSAQCCASRRFFIVSAVNCSETLQKLSRLGIDSVLNVNEDSVSLRPRAVKVWLVLSQLGHSI